MKIHGRVVFFLMMAFLLQEGGWVRIWAAGAQMARSQTAAAPQGKTLPDIKPARLRNEVVVQAAGKRKPYLVLSDGRELLADYEDQTAVALESLPETAEPKGLASGDFDEDGMPDLVCAYATKTGGVIAIYRGNVDAVYPNSPAAKQRKAEGIFSDAAFLSPARVSAVFAAPDLITVGDFDADGHTDVITAQQGSSTLNFMRGDGSGSIGLAEAIVLPGTITALASGDTNRADGLSDLAVAIQAAAGAQLLVFEGINGAIKSSPEEIPLPEAASALAMGYLNDDADGDIAVAAGNELLIVHGRDRKLSLDARSRAAAPAASVSSRLMPGRLTALAIGDFTGDMRLELGAATADGSVFLVSDHTSTISVQSAGQRQEALSIEALAHSKGSSHAQLVGANFSGLNHETLLMTDGANQKMYLWADDNERRERGDITLTAPPGVRDEPATLDVQGEPVAVLPMRLNRDGLNDLVVLRKGHAEPVILTTLINTFVVCNNSDCGGSGCGSLRDLINTVNSQPVGGSYAISFDSQAFQNVPTISISNSLPAINRATVLDGGSTGNCGNNTLADDVTAQALAAVQVTSNNFPNAFRITNSSCVIENFVINHVNNGITLDPNTSNNQVVGNKVGTNINGNGTIANNGRGIFINNARNNAIGSNVVNLNNTISGNNVGLDISAGSDNVVVHTHIGANAALNAVLGNNLNVRISNGATRNTIGSAVINNNSFVNAIWGSGGDGVLIDSAPGNTLRSNFVRQNQGDGIEVRSSSGNLIGGTANGLTVNFVWSNGNSGVNINGSVSTNNLVQANNIGVFLSDTGAQDAHNNGHGVLITDNASNNAVGSPTAGLGNYVAFNSLNGITVISGVGNLIASNRIFNNALLGIDLGNDGPDTNDPLDADTGPNNKQNFPIITAITGATATAPDEVAAQAVTSVSGTMMGEKNTTYTLEFDYCSQPCAASGRQFAGCIPSKLLLTGDLEPMVTTNNDGVALYAFQFTLPNNATTGFINATARKNSNNDTSEISPCRQIGTQSCDFILNPPTASVGAASSTGSFTVTVQNGCTWTAVSSDTSWLTTTSSGNGNGTVTYSYAQNPNANSRSATINVGGQLHTVTQAGASSLAITNVEKQGKNFVVTGVGFVAGDSTLFVNGEAKKTRVDAPTSIFSKKGAKAVPLPAKLQVRNSNGSVSNEWTFPQP